MKIGIFTLPFHTNYGGILQAYALQTALRSLGHDVQVIRHTGRQTWSVRALVSRLLPGCLPVRCSNGKWSMLSMRRKVVRDAKKEFNVFISERIQYSKSSYNIENYSKIDDCAYDAIIVGSDQVWRPNYTKIIRSYFLNFIKSKNTLKIAYAPSFGFSEWEFTAEETFDCARHLKDFKAVSARESVGRIWIKEKFNQDAELVVDPTLLLDAEHYKGLIKRVEPSDSACVYVLDPDVQINKAIDSFLEGRNLARAGILPIALADDLEANETKRNFPPVYEWIAKFYNSKFVITDSFHGTVFAIIFNKPFITLNNHGRGSSRFESILSALGLESRLVDYTDNFEPVVEALPEINWADVNSRLDDWKKKSLAFLTENLVRD